MSQSLPLFLAYTPTAPPPSLPQPFTSVPMAYQVAPDGQLLRAGQGALPQGCVLMIGGTAPTSPAGVDWFCRQALAECQEQHAIGVLANWAVAPAGHSLAQRLAHTLEENQLSFYVPEAFASAAPTAQVLLSSQLSGGTLRERLEDGLARYGTHILLALECSPWDFSLPCPDGQGTALTLPELRERFAQHRCRAWFSQDFCCQYATYSQSGQLHLLLYDNAASVQAKLELAATLGLAGALVCWEEISGFHPPVW